MRWGAHGSIIGRRRQVSARLQRHISLSDRKCRIQVLLERMEGLQLYDPVMIENPGSNQVLTIILLLKAAAKHFSLSNCLILVTNYAAL